MKTLIGINVLESVNSFVYSSHLRFFSNLKKDFPEDTFILFTPYSMSIDNMRNTAAQHAIENNCDYLMFIDDDVMVQVDTYKKLRAADKDIILALTFVRGAPFSPMFFKCIAREVDQDGKRIERLTFYDDYEEHIEEELVKCEAIGFSCALLKMDVVKAVAPPYFVTGPHHTEDVYFCNKARYTLEPEPTIFVHTGCPTVHMMMADGVSVDNVKQLRELYAPGEKLGNSRYERILDSVKLIS
jgi:hypothetical protein